LNPRKFFWINVVSFLSSFILRWHERGVLAFILKRRLNAVSVRAALSVALALPLVPTGTAQAELFWSHYRSGGWDDDLRAAKMNTAADLVERSVSETLTYYAFPDIHWRNICTNNPLERIMKEIRRRTRVVGAFPMASLAST
jgi:hypothetical protein